MPRVKLDAAFCKNVQPGPKTTEYSDADPAYRGLRLVVTPNGDKAFAFRSNPHYQTIGTLPACKLAYARERVADWKLRLKAGQNPFTEIKAAKREARVPTVSGTPTIAELWDEYDREYLAKKSDKHRESANRSMRKHFLPVFGRTPFDAVIGRDLHAFRLKHETARLREMEQMKAYLSGLVSWLARHEAYQDAEWMAKPPRFGKIERDRRTNSGVRTRKLVRESDIRAYWRALNERAGPRATMLALQMLFLSNKRGIDVQRMTADQIDFERLIWRIPVTKNGRPVEQPLTQQMVDVIKQALGNRTNGYVFSSDMGDGQVWLKSSKLHRAICDAAGTDYISTHDYRRTCTTALQELGVPERVWKLMEGHYDKGVEAHYAQAERRPRDEQLAAYRKWEAFLAGDVDFPEWGAVA